MVNSYYNCATWHQCPPEACGMLLGLQSTTVARDVYEGSLCSAPALGMSVDELYS